MTKCIAIRVAAFEEPGTFEPLLRMRYYEVMMIEGPKARAVRITAQPRCLDELPKEQK